MDEVRACDICGSIDLRPVLWMGKQPLAERLDSDETYPLALSQCVDCSLVQLDYRIDQKELFPPDHPYATGNTRMLRDHYATLARELSWRMPGNRRLAVDIGANDGTFLQELQNTAGYDAIAVEPTRQSLKARDKRMKTIQDFWTSDLALRILDDKGPARLITAMNVLAHVPDPHDFVMGVADLLAEDGLFLTENHDWASVTEGLQIDTIYHEHARYYSVASLSRLLSMHGLQVFSVEQIPTHGGSLRVMAEETPGLGRRAEAVAAKLNLLMTQIISNGGKVYGIGATTRATPLIHYTGIASHITCICEVPSSQKLGHTLPGTSIPIVDENRLIKDQPSHALLLSWHIAGDLIPKLRQAGFKGKFIVPLPEPVIRMSDRFEDSRGVIQDLLGSIDSVTEIFTKQGAVRGNHVHRQTEQWTYIVWGSMKVAQGSQITVAGQGSLVHEPAGIPHAWQALEPTKVLVFTRGPRSGENYESDTVRLSAEERLL